MLALKQIAHNAGTGETVVLRHLLNRAAGGQQLLGGFAETQGGNVLHEADADLFMKQAGKPASETNSAAATSCSEIRR